MVSRRPRLVWACADPTLSEQIARELAGEFDVIRADDGVAALQAIRENAPDGVVADVVMRQLSGPSLLRVLRLDPTLRWLPIVLIADGAANEDDDALADGYLVYPCTGSELRATVARTIEQGQIRREWAVERAAMEEMARTEPNPRAASAPHVPALAQIERHRLQREPLDLTAIARGIVADLRGGDPTREVDIRIRDGLSAVADRELVGLLLGHLLGNAWKFTRPRARAQITFEPDGHNGFVVRDNGVGFDQQESSRLFEPFQRLHASADFAGEGIGLSAVRRIVERHGGDAWAYGKVDHGATVWFTLGPGSIPDLD